MRARSRAPTRRTTRATGFCSSRSSLPPIISGLLVSIPSHLLTECPKLNPNFDRAPSYSVSAESLRHAQSSLCGCCTARPCLHGRTELTSATSACLHTPQAERKCFRKTEIVPDSCMSSPQFDLYVRTDPRPPSPPSQPKPKEVCERCDSNTRSVLAMRDG